MNFLILLKTLALGIIEGLTEFLPVSSTGHLIVAERLMNLSGEFWEMFEVVIQFGAILAVCFYYRVKLLDVAFHLNHKPERDFALKLFVALIPALVIGGLFHHLIKEYLFSAKVVAITAIIGGVLIWVIEKTKPQAEAMNLDHISFKQAFLIGCFQTLAIVPGTSRSGATIMGGLLLKLERRVATEFSFFLAIPTMAAATMLDLWKNRDALQGGNDALLALGFVTAFVAALGAIRLFLAYVSRRDFIPFAIYRIAFGAVMWWWVA